jgi:selenide,water dikinase
MGGTPISALSILCYPGNGDIEVLRQILHGGAKKLQEAGCVLLGGHSVSDDEIKFGFAVTGKIHPERIWTNSGAKQGDLLVLTKPLGTGIISTALKRGFAAEEHVANPSRRCYG